MRLLAPKNSHPLFLFVFLATLMMAAGGVAAAKKKPPAGPPTDLPGRVNYLAQKLYGVMVDDSGPVTTQIDKLVLSHLRNWMNVNLPKNALPTAGLSADVLVRRELEADFGLLHYPLYAWPKTFAVVWKGAPLVGAGWTLGWTDQYRVNSVALFRPVNGSYEQVALTHYLEHYDLDYAFLDQPASGDFRFLAYGKRLGLSQPRIGAVLYEFDGQSLKPLWHLEELYDGRINVGANWVMFRYVKESEFVQATAHNRTPPRYEAIYKSTPAGLELQSQHTVPFAER